MEILCFITLFLGTILSYFQPLLLLYKGNHLGLNIRGGCLQEIIADPDVQFDNKQEWGKKKGESGGI
jgi:hypothetical protein